MAVLVPEISVLGMNEEVQQLLEENTRLQETKLDICTLGSFAAAKTCVT